jgi:hypothetical protein
VVVFLAFTTLVGALTKGFIGRRILLYGELVVERMPGGALADRSIRSWGANYITGPLCDNCRREFDLIRTCAGPQCELCPNQCLQRAPRRGSDHG